MSYKSSQIFPTTFVSLNIDGPADDMGCLSVSLQLGSGVLSRLNQYVFTGSLKCTA